MDLGAANRKSFTSERRVGFVAGGALSDPRVLRQNPPYLKEMVSGSDQEGWHRE